MERVIFKIGGSVLFSMKSLAEQVGALLNEIGRVQVFVIVGGGEVVEAMRQLHRQRPEIDHRWMHWECVRLLDTTFAIAAQLYPAWQRIASSVELEAVLDQEGSGIYLVRVGSYYAPDAMERVPIEMRPAESWDTTTDALAWYLGWCVDATEICLLKSCPWREEALLTNEQLVKMAEEGVVDRELPRLLAKTPRMGIRIRSVVESSE